MRGAYWSVVTRRRSEGDRSVAQTCGPRQGITHYHFNQVYEYDLHELAPSSTLTCCLRKYQYFAVTADSMIFVVGVHLMRYHL